ncbi:hypothetical protein VTI28DRAFT_2569 [Corynascus sepedonium]
MVHVKDKADELVKIDLDIFNPSSKAGQDVPPNSVFCGLRDYSFRFQYSTTGENEWSTLNITLQNPSDVDTVLRELSSLGIDIVYERANHDRDLVPGTVAFGSWGSSGQSYVPTYRPGSNPRRLDPSSALSISGSAPYDPHLPKPESHSYLSSSQRPPSQLIGLPAVLRTGQRPWSPAFVPSLPATTLGVPGLLGEGIYKVSKVGSASSGRPRLRRTTTPHEHHGPRLYTASKHFDRTLSRADTLHAPRSQDLGRRSSSNLQDDSVRYPSRSPTLGVRADQSQAQFGENKQASTSYENTSNHLKESSVYTQYHPRLWRLRTINDTSEFSLLERFDETTQQSTLSSVTEKIDGHEVTKPNLALRAADDSFSFSSSPTLFESPTDPRSSDEWLLQVSQAQHQGLAEASRIWNEFVERVSKDMASAEPSKGLAGLLSKHEDEFAKRWNGVIAAATHQMRQGKRDVL